MSFHGNKFEIKTVITNNLLNDIYNLMFGDVVIHHSHFTDEIVGCHLKLCNRGKHKAWFPYFHIIFSAFIFSLL